MTGYILCKAVETETYTYPAPLLNKGFYKDYEQLINDLIILNQEIYNKYQNYKYFQREYGNLTFRELIEKYLINPETDYSTGDPIIYTGSDWYIAYGIEY